MGTPDETMDLCRVCHTYFPRSTAGHRKRIYCSPFCRNKAAAHLRDLRRVARFEIPPDGELQLELAPEPEPVKEDKVVELPLEPVGVPTLVSPNAIVGFGGITVPAIQKEVSGGLFLYGRKIDADGQVVTEEHREYARDIRKRDFMRQL